MGERFLVLDEAAAALDGVDPGLAEQFRLTNGLPRPPGAALAGGGEAGSTPVADADVDHEIRMEVDDDGIRCDCSCGLWSSQVDLDAVDTMVIRIRHHLGTAPATSDDGIRSTSTIAERRVG
jgi:hypothetical protein